MRRWGLPFADVGEGQGIAILTHSTRGADTAESDFGDHGDKRPLPNLNEDPK